MCLSRCCVVYELAENVVLVYGVRMTYGAVYINVDSRFVTVACSVGLMRLSCVIIHNCDRTTRTFVSNGRREAKNRTPWQMATKDQHIDFVLIPCHLVQQQHHECFTCYLIKVSQTSSEKRSSILCEPIHVDHFEGEC